MNAVRTVEEHRAMPPGRAIGRLRRPVSTLLALALLSCGLAISPAASAEDTGALSWTPAVASGLEGVILARLFAAEDEAALTVKDGGALDGCCLAWGYTPTPRWARRVAEGLRFLAELEGPESGTLRHRTYRSAAQPAP
jgi:hypothetical protein